jgi:lambda family phage tail tape measure protein
MAENIKVTLILDDTQFAGKLTAAKTSTEAMGTAVRKAGDEGNTSFTKLSSAAENLKSKMSNLATVILGVGFVEMARHSLEFSDNLLDLSKGTDITIVRLLQLREAFEANGGSADGLGKIVTKLNNILNDARDGGAEAQEAMLKLGLSFSDMANLNTDQALAKVITKLAAMTDPVERNALAFKVLGKEAKNIDWNGVNADAQGFASEMLKYAQAIEDAGRANDKLKAASERLTIAFVGLLEQTGVLKFINDMSTDMAKFEKTVVAAGIAIGIYFGAKAVIMIVEFAAAISKVIIVIEELAIAMTLLEKGTAFGRILSVITAVGLAAATYFGIDKAMTAVDENAKKRTEDAIAKQKELEAQKNKTAGAGSGGGNKPAAAPVTPAWAKEVEQINQLSEAYKRNNNDIIKRLQLDTSLVGVSQEKAKAQQALLDAEKSYNKEIQSINDRLKQEALTPQSAARDARIGQLRKEKGEITSLYEENKKTLEAELQANIRVNEELRKKTAYYEMQISFENRLLKIQDEANKFGLSEREKKYYDIRAAARDSGNEAIRNEEKLLGYQRNSITGEIEKIKISQQRADEIRRLYDEQAAKEEEMSRKQEEYARTFEAGWKNAYAQYVDDATNAAKKAESIFQKTTQGMEDMIINFAKTGKFEFKGFINSILEDLLRSQVRQLIGQVFGLGGGTSPRGGGGGLLGAVGSLLGFADGGTIGTNSPVIVGERGPELLVGGAGRTVVSNEDLKSSIGGSGTSVTYNINAVDAMSFKQMVAADPSFLYAVSEQGRRAVPMTRR